MSQRAPCLSIRVRGFPWGPASERSGLLPVHRDRSSRLSCWSVLSVLAPAVAGQHRYLIFSVILSSFSHSAGTGMDGECLAAETETCRVVFLPVCKLWSPRLTPAVGGPGSVYVPGWIRHCCGRLLSTLGVGRGFWASLWDLLFWPRNLPLCAGCCSPLMLTVSPLLLRGGNLSQSPL